MGDRGGEKKKKKNSSTSLHNAPCELVNLLQTLCLETTKKMQFCLGKCSIEIERTFLCQRDGVINLGPEGRVF